MYMIREVFKKQRRGARELVTAGFKPLIDIEILIKQAGYSHSEVSAITVPWTRNVEILRQKV